jgi:hypothetical protein
MGGNRELRVRRVRAGILSCLANLIFLAPLVSTTADEYPGGEPPATTNQSSQNNSMHKSLPNFGEATTTLYHGGQPSKTGFRMLAKMGVSIVVDLRGSRDSERKIVTHRYGAIIIAVRSSPNRQWTKIFVPEFFSSNARNSANTLSFGKEHSQGIAAYCIPRSYGRGGLVSRESQTRDGKVWLFVCS